MAEIEALKPISHFRGMNASDATKVRVEEALVRARKLVQQLETIQHELQDGQQMDWGCFGDATRVSEEVNRALRGLGVDIPDEE